ncbi:MAG: flagellar motor protein MotB, partial [Paracoccaceae bacterium]
MAGLGRGRHGQGSSVWAGFLDLMTALVMVLMFVLTVFMIVQFALRETINDQGDALSELNLQLADLADSLGLEKSRNADLQAEIGSLTASLLGLEEEKAALTNSLAGAEAQNAALAAELSSTEGALATATAELGSTKAALSSAEGQLAALNQRLEAERARAEETLTLLAAAKAAEAQLSEALATQLSEADRQKGLLAAANSALSEEQAISAEGARKLTLLNEQVAALRRQMGALEELLDASAAKDAASAVQIEALGSKLNSALARVAAEEKRRAELEAAEKERLAQEALAAQDEVKELAKYRSEFFGRLSQLLAGRDGVRVVGDRFVFSSEVLFE